MNQGGKPKGWWFKWGGIWEAAESTKLLNLKFYAKSFPMESCRVGRKPWDVEVGEVEIWRLGKLRYGGWRSSRTQLTVEADPYTHHSPVSHTHPNWEHKYVTSPFSDPSKQSNKRHVCAFAVQSVYYCQEWTRLNWQWVHLLDQLPVELSPPSKSIQIPSSRWISWLTQCATPKILILIWRNSKVVHLFEKNLLKRLFRTWLILWSLASQYFKFRKSLLQAGFQKL